MRRLVVGTGPDGRSAVVADGPPPSVYRFGGADGDRDPHDLKGLAASDGEASAAPGEVVVSELWATLGGDRPDGTDPTATADGFDVECPPGGTRWRIVEMGAGRERPMHRTVTVDYDLVLAGEIDLLLEDGPVRLRAGDAVVLPGVVHGWRTAKSACTMAVAMVALPDD
jgi:quercetin dioxygenase-like cupin family protein